MNVLWSIKKKYGRCKAQRLLNKDDLLNEYVKSFLRTIEFWDNNPEKFASLNFKISDPLTIMKKWLSYENQEDLYHMRNLLYRFSADFSDIIGLQMPPLVLHNFNKFGGTGGCIPLENDSTFSSLVFLPVFQPEYTDWRIPLIVRLAHEIGHAFVFQNWRSDYCQGSWQAAAQSIQVPAIMWDSIIDVWMHNWFHELLADLIAALLVGPAGIYWDQKEYITMRRSLNQQINVGSRTHPPDLLRTFWKVNILKLTNTPRTEIDNLETTVCRPYNGMTLEFTGLERNIILSTNVVNYFFSMATDWLHHFGVTFDWNEIENRCILLNQGSIPQDRVGLTGCALLHSAMNRQITGVLDRLTQQFGSSLP